MTSKISPPIHKRVIMTSVAIIFAFTVVLALVLNQLYKKNHIALYSVDLLTAVPSLVRELKQDKIITLNALPNQNETQTSQQDDYLAFICHPDKTLFWMSRQSQGKNFSQICASLPASLTKPALFFFNERPYLVHQVVDASRHVNGSFFVIREVSPQLENLAAIKRKTWFYLGILFVIATAMIYAASYWSFTPLRKLADELNEIALSHREQLNEKYPPELEEVTEALNRMITQRKEQTQRYRHAMDDLAHSLKSRLAATNAIIDDDTLTRNTMNKRIIEQVSQMDNMVEYQLKRALIGQCCLVRESAELRPEIDSLTGMFAKIYSDKPVNITIAFHDTQTVPINKADLTELLGNLLENAFRFCITEIRICNHETPESHVLIIEDDGPGVPAKYRESIFQRGVRADQRNPGTGIGLAVCDEIVKSYAGTIRVDVSPLEGAAFIMTFPKSR